MSGRPIIHLHKRPTPAPRIAAWMAALAACDPKSPEAKAIYCEVIDAGLAGELRAEGRGPRLFKLGRRLYCRQTDLRVWLDTMASEAA